MTKDEHLRLVTFRSKFLEHAKRIGNVSATCRYFGISREKFYKWKKRFDELGAAGLADRPRRPHRSPNETPRAVVSKVLYLRQNYHFGAGRIRDYLKRFHDIRIAGQTVQNILRKHGLGRLPANQKHQPHGKRWKRYEKPQPGHRLQMDVKFLERIPGTKKRMLSGAQASDLIVPDPCTRVLGMIRTALVLLCVAACSKSEPGVMASPDPRPAASGSDASSCALAMVVDARGVSIGTPAGACRAERVGGKLDVRWIEAELRRLRSAFASCSVDAVVVAETGPYQELITLMDIAVKTGFVDTSVGDMSDLHFVVTGARDAHCKLPSPSPETPVASSLTQQTPTSPLSPEQASQIADKLNEGIPLPPPSTNSDLQQAPVIIVTRTEIMFRGQVVASVDVVANDPQALKPLADLLHADAGSTKHKLATGSFSPELVKACEDAQHGIRPLPGRICPLGLAILQADEATDMRVINALLRVAKGAGFDNLLFAVKNM